MAACSVTVKVRVRWWVMPYLSALAFFCRATGAEPDEEKVAAFVLRWGVVVRRPE